MPGGISSQTLHSPSDYQTIKKRTNECVNSAKPLRLFTHRTVPVAPSTTLAVFSVAFLLYWRQCIRSRWKRLRYGIRTRIQLYRGRVKKVKAGLTPAFTEHLITHKLFPSCLDQGLNFFERFQVFRDGYLKQDGYHIIRI
jgi:hypothetical protein